MGKILLEIYDEAKKIGGLSAQIKLAILTKIPAPQAEKLPDSIENVTLFQKSINVVKIEFLKSHNNIRGN
jgi:hypothetical protein